MQVTREVRQARAILALPELLRAERELKKVRDTVTAKVAPQSAKKIRSALRSLQGAIRNAERFAGWEAVERIYTGFRNRPGLPLPADEETCLHGLTACPIHPTNNEWGP